VDTFGVTGDSDGRQREQELCSAALILSVMLVESFCSSCTRRRKAVFGVVLVCWRFLTDPVTKT